MIRVKPGLAWHLPKCVIEDLEWDIGSVREEVRFRIRELGAKYFDPFEVGGEISDTALALVDVRLRMNAAGINYELPGVYSEALAEYAFRDAVVMSLVPERHRRHDWRRMMDHFRWKCVYCGVKHETCGLAQDHFIPSAAGGQWHDNIVPACRDCNSTKNAKDGIMWVYQNNDPEKARTIIGSIQWYFENMRAEKHDLDWVEWRRESLCVEAETARYSSIYLARRRE